MKRSTTFSIALVLINVGIFLAVERFSAWMLDRSTPVSDDGRKVTFVVDPYLLWRPEGFWGRVAQFQQNRPANVILSLGDSVTMGFDVPPGRDYSSVLERCLQENPGPHWSVLNLGVEGYSTLQTMRLLERVAPGVGPQIVTLLAGWNDHWEHGRVPDSEISETALWIRALASRLKTGRLLDRLLIQHSTSHGRWVTRVPLSEFSGNLERIDADCRSRGARLILILPVYYKPGLRVDGFQELHERYVEKMRQVARERGIEVVDLISPFMDNPALFSPDSSFAERGVAPVDYIHPNEAGHALLGREICRVISRTPAPGDPRSALPAA
jgi:lysophospholipase L1-like esterase